MNFTDICLVTKDVPTMLSFYETVFNVKAEGDGIHSVVTVGGLNIAIYSKAAAENDMGFDFTGAGTGFLFIGFNVNDADREYARIKQLKLCKATEPRVWPWGAKSFQFQDPDGNFITLRSFPGNL